MEVFPNEKGEFREPRIEFLYRKRTVCFDLNGVTTDGRMRPSKGEVVKWLVNNLKMRPEDLESIQFHTLNRDNVFVKFVSDELAEEWQEKLAEGVKWPNLNQEITGWKCDSRWIYVTVLNASPEVTLEEVEEVFREFGEVKGVKRNLIPFIKREFNIDDGTISLRIKVQDENSIPSWIRRPRNDELERNEECWQIVYKGQVKAGCWKCGDAGHIGVRCRNFNYVPSREQGRRGAPRETVGRSYLDVLKGRDVAVETRNAERLEEGEKNKDDDGTKGGEGTGGVERDAFIRPDIPGLTWKTQLKRKRGKKGNNGHVRANSESESSELGDEQSLNSEPVVSKSGEVTGEEVKVPKMAEDGGMGSSVASPVSYMQGSTNQAQGRLEENDDEEEKDDGDVHDSSLILLPVKDVMLNTTERLTRKGEPISLSQPLKGPRKKGDTVKKPKHASQ